MAYGARDLVHFSCDRWCHWKKDYRSGDVFEVFNWGVIEAQSSRHRRRDVLGSASVNHRGSHEHLSVRIGRGFFACSRLHSL